MQLSNPRKMNPQQQIQDDSTSFASSTCSRRLARKNDQASATKRSNSRHSSQKSLQSLKISSFYTKMSSSNLQTQSTELNHRSSILHRGTEEKKEKKRDGTPVPGIIKRSKQIQKQKYKRDLEIQNDLLIVDLQNKYINERQKNNVLQKKVRNFERELKSKIIKIQCIQKALTQALEREKDYVIRLYDYKKLVSQNQTNLNYTKNKLQKLKHTIKIDRSAELEAENKKFRQQAEQFRNQITWLENQNKKLKQICKNYESDILILKLTEPQLHKQPSKQENFDQMMLSREEYTVKLQTQISKLSIKLNYMNRKKIQEVQKERKKKNEELTRVRNRLTSLHFQLKQVKNENQTLKRQATLPDSFERSTIMTSEHWATHEDIITFSLSPEHFQS